jgi:hypothetical protein
VATLVANPPLANLNVSSSDATAVGLLLSLNDVRGRVSATVGETDLDVLAGNVRIEAIEDATLRATNTGNVAADGGSFFEGGNTIAVNGLIATNALRARADATLRDSDVDVVAGTVTVRAENAALLDSTINLTTTVEGGGTAVGVGVTLAFNTIGILPQNFLFNTVDALFGLLPASEDPSLASATLERSDVSASGDIRVAAVNGIVLDSEIENAALVTSATIKDGTAVSVAPILALNRGSAGAVALVSNAGPITSSAGTLAVTARDTSSIAAKNVASSTSVNLSGGKAISVAVPVAFARNVLRSTVDAGIVNTGTTAAPISAQSVLVSAERAGSVTAVSRATAITLTLGGSGNSVGVSGGGAVAINRLFGSTDARVQGSVLRAGSVTVDAQNTAAIDARVLAVAASASVSLGGNATAVAVGLSVADNVIGWQDAAASPLSGRNEYSSGTASADLRAGDIVRVTSGPQLGRVFQYIGTNADDVDLRIADFSDSQAWRQVGITREGALTQARIATSQLLDRNGQRGTLTVEATTEQKIVASVFAGAVAIGISGSASTAVGGAGAFVRNKIASDAKAAIEGTTGTLRAGATRIEAEDVSSIRAFAGAASLAGAIGSGTTVSVAIGVALALNEISNGAQALVDASTLDVTSLIVRATTSGSGGLSTTANGLTAAQLDDAAEEAKTTASNGEAAMDAADATADASIREQLRARINAAYYTGADAAEALAAGSLTLSKDGQGGWLAATNDGRTFLLGLAGGNLQITRPSISSVAAAASLAASISVGGKAVAIAGAGAYSDNVILTSTLAHLRNSSVVASGDVTVEALNTAEISATVLTAAVSLAFSSGTGVGASLGVAIARNSIGQERNGSANPSASRPW